MILGIGPEAAAGPASSAARRCSAKMAASRCVRAALLLLCASDLLLLPPPGVCATESSAETPGKATPPPRKKKDIRDYNDADMARLLEQWEVRCSRSRSRFFDPLTLSVSGSLTHDLLCRTALLTPHSIIASPQGLPRSLDPSMPSRGSHCPVLFPLVPVALSQDKPRSSGLLSLLRPGRLLLM